MISCYVFHVTYKFCNWLCSLPLTTRAMKTIYRCLAIELFFIRLQRTGVKENSHEPKVSFAPVILVSMMVTNFRIQQPAWEPILSSYRFHQYVILGVMTT